MIGYVYKIESDCKEVLYIGSTIQKLNERFSDHKKKYQKCKITKYINSFNYKFSNGCELLKEYEIVDRKHLLAYEQLFLNRFKHCINGRDAFRMLNKEKLKQYREANKHKIKEWHEANKHKIKQYREDNKDKLSKQKKQYYNDNRDKIKQNYTGLDYQIENNRGYNRYNLFAYFANEWLCYFAVFSYLIVRPF